MSHRSVPNPGQPIKPRTISVFLGALRCFFQDLQESEKIPLAFNPLRYLALPGSVHNKIGLVKPERVPDRTGLEEETPRHTMLEKGGSPNGQKREVK